MRKTGLCGVVIATLFGAAGLLQHPSHHATSQQHHQQSISPMALAGVNLLNSYPDFNGQSGRGSSTLPVGFLRVIRNPGPTHAELAAAYAKAAQLKQAQEAQQQAEVAAQAQAAATAQAEANAEAQAQAQQEAAAQAAAAAQQHAEAVAYARAQAAAAAQAAQAQKQASSSAGGVWLELRDCESGDDYSANTGNGYYGAYQFALSTWQDLGFGGLPSDAPPAVQNEAAEELQARAGWGQWPACSAELGL